MLSSAYTYLLLDLGSIAIPLFCSFDRRINFFSHWKSWLPAILITGSFFIIWDIYFTALGIWGFNAVYLTGVAVINLPLEEWMFFFCIPYACLFTYQALNYLIIKHWFITWQKQITITLVVLLMITGIIFFEKAYTSTTFVLLSIFLLLHLYWFKSDFLGNFYLSYAFILIPFFIVNGILTGSFIPEEVVWYNNQENLGFRIFTIPVEDIFYGMLLILMNISIYEYIKKIKAS